MDATMMTGGTTGLELDLFTVAFCDEEPKAASFVARAGNTYKVGESVWVYAQIGSERFARVCDTIQVHTIAEFKLYNDNQIVSKYTKKNNEEWDCDGSFCWFARDYSDLNPGTYSLDLKVQDTISGEVVNWKGCFKVVA